MSMPDLSIRLETHPAFLAAGRSTFIGGQDNEQFGVFWAQAHQNGLIDTLCGLRGQRPGPVTKSLTFGISRVEKDPNNRAFHFYIACELDQDLGDEALDQFLVPAATWAIFRNRGQLPQALVDAEMHAFFTWLPQSGYQHALAPELEVYPAEDEALVEFWLPVIKV